MCCVCVVFCVRCMWFVVCVVCCACVILRCAILGVCVCYLCYAVLCYLRCGIGILGVVLRYLRCCAILGVC